jgi:hypothetical protein
MQSSLRDSFIVPPFSVLDARQGYWQERKRRWLELIGEMRPTCPQPLFHDVSIGGKTKKIKDGKNLSIFDPVLAEVLLHWFCPVAGDVFDPFGGEAVKGIVAATCGRQYFGVEIRPAQVWENRRIAKRLGATRCTWLIGDAGKLAALVAAQRTFDFVFSSPPYWNLERYRGPRGDLSEARDYGSFLAAFERIVCLSAERLRPGRFMAIKVGNFRDRRGALIDFVGDTARCGAAAGLAFYNQYVLAGVNGAAPLRGRGMMRTRKCAPTHQAVLVFFKGNPREFDRRAFPEIKRYDDPLPAAE